MHGFKFYAFFVNLPLSKNMSKMSIINIMFSNCLSFRFIAWNKFTDHMFMPVCCKSFSCSCRSVHARI